MTREEAIHRLKNTAWLGTDKDREETEQAVDMAITALAVWPQYKWERDVAIEQLDEYGIPFGAKKDDDVVKVVRCKDCIHYESDGGALMVCRIDDMVVDDTDYCSYGERREEGEADDQRRSIERIDGHTG